MPTHPWLSLTAGPPAIALLVALFARRRLSVLVVTAIALFLLLVANAIVANVLTSALTV